MNILIITGIFPPDIGGPATFVPAIAAALVEKGHSVSVITLSDTVNHQNRGSVFSVSRIRRSIRHPLRSIRTVMEILRLGRKADVLFVHGLALEAVAANYFLHKPLVQKVVGDLAWERAKTAGAVRDTIDDFQKKKYSPKIECIKKLRSFWTAQSHLVIVPSCYLKKIVTGWGVPEKKIKVIYNAVQKTETDGQAAPEPVQQHAMYKYTIVSVGRLVPWKGFKELITALAVIPEAQLIIIGEGTERHQLESFIHEQNMHSRVYLKGALPHTEVFTHLRHADLFVLNSSYEGLPHIILEAMAAGAPVIATDAGGTGEIVKHEYNGLLVSSTDTEELRSCITMLLNNKALRDKLVRNGYETLKSFDRSRLIDETESVLRTAAHDSPDTISGSTEPVARRQLPVLFLSTARCGSPPDQTLVKKWRGLEPFFSSTVISFNDDETFSRRMLEGAQWILLPSSMPRMIRYVLYFVYTFIFSFYGTLQKRFKAIIAQSPFQAIAPALALLPWKIVNAASRPKLIIEIHNDWQEGVMLYHRSRFSWMEKTVRCLAGTFSLSQADAYRVISEYCRELLPANSRPVYVFPTFTDLESFCMPSATHVQEIARYYGTGYFIYAGMLIYLKGIHHLIQAFKGVLPQHPEARLVIAGKGPEENSLKLQAETLQLDKHIHFVGHLDQNNLAAFIQNSRALVLPSLTEGLGRVALEAHLLERPVIASRTGGIPEVVLDNKTGILCEPGNEKALCDALIKILDNPDLAMSMGKAGRQAVLKKFNYANYYQSYYDMIKKTCTE